MRKTLAARGAVVLLLALHGRIAPVAELSEAIGRGGVRP